MLKTLKVFVLTIDQSKVVFALHLHSQPFTLHLHADDINILEIPLFPICHKSDKPYYYLF